MSLSQPDGVIEMAKDSSTMKGAVTLSVGTMGVFNYALYENRIAPVRNIKLINHTDHIIEGLSLKISTDSGFFKDWQAPLPTLPIKKEAVKLSDPNLIIDGQHLAEVTDAFTINVSVSLLAEDEEIDSVTEQMNILAYDQWMGEEWAEYLSAFVIPNHPVVMMIVHDASMILKAWHEDPSLEGYQGKDPLRVRMLAAAIFEAIKRKEISYSNPPAAGGVCPMGQRIRTPEIIMEQRLATCMDFSLLYASCLEAIDLHPVLYLKRGHIFTGLWLVDETHFKHARNVDLGEVIKNITPGSQKIIFVECTMMQAGNDATFADAEYKPSATVFTKSEFE